jgi:hypothetical protein
MICPSVIRLDLASKNKTLARSGAAKIGFLVKSILAAESRFYTCQIRVKLILLPAFHDKSNMSFINKFLHIKSILHGYDFM